MNLIVKPSNGVCYTVVSSRFFLTLLLSAACCASGWSAPSKPNVLFLFTDDQPVGTIHALGASHIRTPNMDRLVAGGTAFTNAYIMGGSSPGVCLPSRAMLMSGRTLWNIESRGMWGYEISSKNKTLPEVFRDAGYATFATGKNDPGKSGHFGRAYTHGDKLLFQGMSQQYRMPLHSFQPDGTYSGAKAAADDSGRQSAEVYADAVIRFLESRAGNDQPFYAYVAFQTPHDPRTAPAEYHAMYLADDMPLPPSFLPKHPFDNGMLDIRDEKCAPFPRTEKNIRKHISDFCAVLTHTDAQIGRILTALEKSGKMDNTLIVLASDNGLALGAHGLMGKQNIYEHSVKVPLVLGGPGVPRGETRDQLCYMQDIHPTLEQMAGLAIPDTVEFKSLVPILAEKSSVHREHLYHAFMSWQRAIRKGSYKLIEYRVGDERHTQLFDLAKDPYETTNLADKEEKKPTVESLRALLKEERVRLHDGNTPHAFANQQGLDFWSP